MKKSLASTLFLLVIFAVSCGRAQPASVSIPQPVKNTTVPLSIDTPQLPTATVKPLLTEVLEPTLEPAASPPIQVIDGETVVYTLEDLFFSLNVSVVFVDSAGGVWASSGWGVWASSGTQNKIGDLSYFDGETWISYSATRLPTAKLYRVAEAPDGSIWVAAESSGSLILHFDVDEGVWTTHQVAYDGINFAAHDIAVAPDGVVWVVDADSGRFASFDAGIFVDYQIPIFNGKTRGTECTSIEIDGAGTVWITCGFKMHRVADGQHTTFTLEDGMPANINPRSVVVEPGGAIWMGTDVGAATTHDGVSWTYYGREDGLVGKYVLSISIADNGDVYFGTDEGISMFDGETWYTIPVPDELLGIGIKTVAAAPDGSLWYGSSRGLMYFIP